MYVETNLWMFQFNNSWNSWENNEHTAVDQKHHAIVSSVCLDEGRDKRETNALVSKIDKWLVLLQMYSVGHKLVYRQHEE